ncbi:hypothetical protein SAMN02746093_02399 [Legionella quinlivanii DSM 21216]|uniref:hypothetical protein n=1 Tax=Legionella quinlivanii TaxID=45073 RepID=UPI00089F10A3|nr:hypothetical protein [Legionella quinlivanii]SEG28116.1 hypothetical protein SAMN02746093_02399 [Legionella quinlivanii DSM 21216]
MVFEPASINDDLFAELAEFFTRKNTELHLTGDIVNANSLRCLEKRSPQLTTLALQGQPTIEHETALAIIRVIKNSRNLKKVILGSLSEQSIIDLTAFFKSSNTIRDLEFRYTNFHMKSGGKLAEMLSENARIQKLCLFNCRMDKMCLSMITRVVIQSNNLMDIEINGVSLASENVNQLLINEDEDTFEFYRTMAVHLKRDQRIRQLWPEVENATGNRDILKMATLFSQLKASDLPSDTRFEIIEGFWNLQCSISEADVKIAYYRLMLWLLREEQNCPFYQQIIRSCVRQLQTHENKQLVNLDSLMLGLYNDSELLLVGTAVFDVETFMASLYQSPVLELLEQDQVLLNSFARRAKIWSVSDSIYSFFYSVWDSANQFLETGIEYGVENDLSR